MIIIPNDYRNSAFMDTKFRKLIDFFNQLEKDLEYPNCGGKTEAKLILNKAQHDLIMWGII